MRLTKKLSDRLIAIYWHADDPSTAVVGVLWWEGDRMIWQLPSGVRNHTLCPTFFRVAYVIA